MGTILIPENQISNKASCLEEFIQNNRIKTKKFLPGQIASSDSDIFEKNIFNITNLLDTFLKSEDREIALLVLGKIQSGKTANLLGTLAWAADSPISLAVMFTGITEALNLQTERRIKKDLMQLQDQYVKILNVPTNASGKAYEDLLQTVSRWVERRTQNRRLDLNRPLPILVTLKNPARVRTLRSLISTIEKMYGHQITTLLIDDEADQASQNAKAQKHEVTATYDAIRSLRDLHSRNILLSYTATPQAVLLTENSGRLRPNYCVTVEPRTGYFGLADAVDEKFAVNRINVYDWDKETLKKRSVPISLRHAIIRFSWTAWIRFHKKNFFYAGSGLEDESLSGQIKSVQMLVHESFSQKKHSAVFKLIDEEVKVIIDLLTRAALGELSNSELSEMHRVWQEDLDKIIAGLPESQQKELKINIDKNFWHQMLNLFDSLAIQVVNSDRNRPGRQDPLPVEDENWEEFKLWILIGGDILGRGLTIPQLTTTYFLRNSKKPNFDTVSQQMRFCGYRKNYSHCTYLFAEETNFNLFEFMNQIDTAIWRLAKKWDREKQNILRDMPIVMYASKPNLKLDPCRKSVRDPDLLDKKIQGELILSLKSIMNPRHVKQNIQILRNFITETDLAGNINGEWYIYFEPSDEKIQRLLASWIAIGEDRSLLSGTAELFTPEIGDLGLSEIPRNILIHKDLLDKPTNEIDWLIDRDRPTRKVQSLSSDVTIKNWKTIYNLSISGKYAQINWPHLIVRHVGDGQRSIRNELSPYATTLMIEPMLGHVAKNQDSVTAGIAFSIFTPNDYEVRMIGLDKRIESLGNY